MAWRQETFKGESYCGVLRKCVLTIGGRNDYTVAYYKNPSALKCDMGTADFNKRKDAMRSIETFLEIGV
jgi:hypothetical protein